MVDNIKLVHTVCLTPQELYEFVLEYQSYLEDMGVAYQTVRRYKNTFDKFFQWLGSDDFTRERYVDWLTENEALYKVSTLQSRHSQMNCLFEFLVMEKQLSINPLIGLMVPRPGRPISIDTDIFRSSAPYDYYMGAKQSYELYSTEKTLVWWVYIELLYTFGCTPDLMPSFVLDLETGSYAIEGLPNCSGLRAAGPTEACKLMAARIYKQPKEFQGTMVQSKDMSAAVTRALSKTRNDNCITARLSPREFIINFCGRVLHQGGTVTDLHNRTGHSLAWCYAVAQSYRECLDY